MAKPTTPPDLHTRARHLVADISLNLHREGFCHTGACCEFANSDDCQECAHLVALVEAHLLSAIAGGTLPSLDTRWSVAEFAMNIARAEGR